MFFLVTYGRRRLYKTLGFAAGFCATCHDIQTLRIQEVASQGQLYGMSTDRPHVHGHRAVCTVCGDIQAADSKRFPRLLDEAPASGLELIRRTNPALGATMRERFLNERQLRRDPQKLDPSVRGELLAEPFLRHDAVARGINESGWAFLVWLFCLSGILAPLVLATVALTGSGPMNPCLIVAAVLFVGDAPIGWFCWRRWRRAPIKLDLLRAILRGLAPLNPSDAELAVTLQRARVQAPRVTRLWPARVLRQGLAALKAGKTFEQVPPIQLTAHFEAALTLADELARMPAADLNAAIDPADEW
ncbi:MAG: hypothetical protein ACREJ2_12100 [Planctomycetota bacterium]